MKFQSWQIQAPRVCMRSLSFPVFHRINLRKVNWNSVFCTLTFYNLYCTSISFKELITVLHACVNSTARKFKLLSRSTKCGVTSKGKLMQSFWNACRSFNLKLELRSPDFEFCLVILSHFYHWMLKLKKVFSRIPNLWTKYYFSSIYVTWL